MPTEPQTAAAVDLVEVLCGLSKTYGRGICRDPQRVAAILSDLCPHNKREIFLLVSVLKEHVVDDLVVTLDTLPTDALIERGASKLRSELGLSDDSARWAVSSWLPACRVLATAPEIVTPLPNYPIDMGDPPREAEGVEWSWIGLSAIATFAAILSLATGCYLAMNHGWITFTAWLRDTGTLAGGLAISAALLLLVEHRCSAHHDLLHAPAPRNRFSLVLAADLLVLLLLPAVPALLPPLWAAEWSGLLHTARTPHDLAFHLGRILQCLVMALFLIFWITAMLKIQTRVARTFARRG